MRGGGRDRFGIPFGWVGEFTTHVRAYFSGWIGMFIGGTIWILTHGHMEVHGALEDHREKTILETGNSFSVAFESQGVVKIGLLKMYLFLTPHKNKWVVFKNSST